MNAKERFERILARKDMLDDAEEIVEVVYDFLMDEVTRLRNDEPYATNTISEMETAARVVWRMLDN